MVKSAMVATRPSPGCFRVSMVPPSPASLPPRSFSPSPRDVPPPLPKLALYSNSFFAFQVDIYLFDEPYVRISMMNINIFGASECLNPDVLQAVS